MKVDMPIYHWTLVGMKQHIPNAEGFVTVLDAEHALEAAHKRGYELGYEAALEKAHKVL